MDSRFVARKEGLSLRGIEKPPSLPYLKTNTGTMCGCLIFSVLTFILTRGPRTE